MRTETTRSAEPPRAPGRGRDRGRRQRLLRHRDGRGAETKRPRDFVVLEKRRRRRGDLAREHLPGLSLRRPQPRLLVLVRPEPRLERDLLPAARDPGLPRARRRRRGAARARALRLRAQRRELGRRRRPLAARDLRRAARRQGADRRRRARCTSRSCPRSPGSRASRGRSSTPRPGTTTTTSIGERVAVIGTGASAIQFVPQIQPRVARLHVFQRTAPWVMPRRDRRFIARRASPVSRACPPPSG